MKMKVSLSKARSRPVGLIEGSRSSGREIVIARRGIPVAVLMDHETYLSGKETTSEPADRALMREIRHGLQDLKAGKARLYTLDDQFSNK